MLSPHSLQGAKATWSLNVTYNTNHHQWWGFNDGNSFHNFFLVDLCQGTIATLIFVTRSSLTKEYPITFSNLFLQVCHSIKIHACVLTLWFLKWPKLASKKCSVFPELAKTSQPVPVPIFSSHLPPSSL